MSELKGIVNTKARLKGTVNPNSTLKGLVSVGGALIGAETAKRGLQGNDGYSPTATVSKVGSTATITITDKNGTTTATVSEGTGGTSAFVAVFGDTSYADVKTAYDNGDILICTLDDSGNTAVYQFTYFDATGEIFYFTEPNSNGIFWACISNADGWDSGSFDFASTDTATTLSDGLMSYSDKSKLDGIASGAEVNVQSDWSEADNTKDDYIKNKPTIPSKTSDLLNDSGFLHGNTRGSFYGTCSTAAATAAKEVSITGFTSSDRVIGAVVYVMIGHTNTAAVTDLTLNVSGTGAKSIKYINNGTMGNLPSAGYLETPNVYPFYFDGDYWICMFNSTPAIHNVPSGGTSGQVLAKASGTDYDLAWTNQSGGKNVWYGTCSTSASSSPKSITTTSGDFSLTTGSILCVLFSHTNSLSSVSFEVDGGTSKSVYPLDGTSNMSNRWGSSELAMFVYDGTKFIMLEQGSASTTAYGITKLNNTTTSTSTSEAATANAVKSAYDLANGKANAVHTHTVSDVTDFPSLATVATTGDYDDLTDTPAIHNVPSGGSSGQVLSKASGTDYDLAWVNQSGGGGGVTDVTQNGTSVVTGGVAAVTVPTDTGDLTNGAGFITGMAILSYGSSTWNDFLTAYNANKVVYCRASSNANPGSGTQGRFAFMAYVNFSGSTPTSVEFQYYRSVSSHSDSQQGDQVFVYKLSNDNTWSVTTREAYSKIAAGSGLNSSYSSGTLTLKHSNSITAQTTQALYPIKIDAQGHISAYGTAATIPTNVSELNNDSGFITGYTETDPVFSASAAAGITATDISNWNNGKLSLDTSAAAGTTDGDLYAAIVALGWASDVIE